MGIIQNLSSFALEQLIGGICKGIAFKTVEDGVNAAVSFLGKHLTDHSQKITQALRTTNERAWKALEIALAGDSLWEKCKALLCQADQKAFALQVRSFLDAHPLPEFSNKAQFRQVCLRELRAARTAGILSANGFDLQGLARQAGGFARFTDPQGLLNAEWQALKQAADELRQLRFSSLAWFLELRPQCGHTVLVAAVRFFFRREIETDAALARGLAWAAWENLAAGQQNGFTALAAALTQNGQRAEDILDSLARIEQGMLDIGIEIRGQRDQIAQLGQAVLGLLEQHKLAARELTPKDSLSIRGPEERQQVKQLLEWHRALPKERQAKLPALLNGLGKLQHATGDFAAARASFVQVASSVQNPLGRAEAHHNAYLAALECHDWAGALRELQAAFTLDAERFAPFSLTKYEPIRILGAGGFGVAFLCRHRILQGLVVIKTLRLDNLERDAADVVREAKLMVGLDHEAIISLKDCDYADTPRTRLFLVMDYFDGMTLTNYVEQHGSLKPSDFLELFRRVAEGLQAAHSRGILHRDVTPANLMVRKDESGWQVKLIDFGLAVKEEASQGASANNSDAYGLAGTWDYAAPEQVGRLSGVPIGPHSDIYGFGKTSCYALFKMPHPLGKHWRKLSESLSNWLDSCIAEHPKDRLSDFATVLKRLDRVRVRFRVKVKAKGKAKVVRNAPVSHHRLVVVRGLKVNAEYPLHEGLNVIGRGPVDVDLEEQELPNTTLASRQHCRVRLENGDLFVEDLSSGNGTFVNRVRVGPGQKQPLKVDDCIQVGAVQLKVKG